MSDPQTVDPWSSGEEARAHVNVGRTISTGQSLDHKWNYHPGEQPGKRRGGNMLRQYWGDSLIGYLMMNNFVLGVTPKGRDSPDCLRRTNVMLRSGHGARR